MSAHDIRTIAGWLAGIAASMPVPVIAINGAQGSGKSTLAGALRAELAQAHGLRAPVLSLDDLYLPLADREKLAAEVHPLLRTRGVPGTHDVRLGSALLQQLRSGQQGVVRVPKFVKAADDRAPEREWTPVATPVQLILFEGWCVGTPAQSEAALHEPVNALERQEDADRRWRRWVNEKLAVDYAPLFSCIDRLLFLQAPDFDSIFRWRMQQEQGNAAMAGRAPMSAEQLRRFIQHYERLSRHALDVLPARADLGIELGREHEMLQLRFRAQG